MKKLVLTILMLCLLQGVCLASDWSLKEEIYTVKAGDTMESIAQEYMKKNTYGPRESHEFIEGILELNNMSVADIHVGDKLRINYWIKKGK